MHSNYNYKLIQNILTKNSAEIFSLADILQEMSDRVFDRLDYIKLVPKNILDCGYGIGYDNKLLKQKYSLADIYNLDLIINNLPRNNSSWFKGIFNKAIHSSVVANVLQLPIKSNSMDLVYANQIIPYLYDIEKFIKEVFRSLNIGGACLLSGLGVDSFKELREYGLSTFRFPDMHDIGDMMINAGFNNPVVDTEYITLKYDSLAQALRDIKTVGAGAANVVELRKFLDKNTYAKIKQDMQKPIFITLEVFVVHGWKDSIKLDLPQGVSPIKFSKS